MMKTLRDFVLVEVEDRFKRSTGKKGLNGLDIQTSIDEEDDYLTNQQVKTWGRVIAIPDTLSRQPIAQETQGTPSYQAHGSYKYKYRSDIEMEVEIGDKIYFHHNTLFAGGGIKNQVAKGVYKVAYDSIQCALREMGYDHKVYLDLTMIGGYVLIRPDIESWDEILLPTYETSNGIPLVDKNGERIPRPKEKWLQTKTEPEAKYLQGFVVAVGSPLKGDICEIEVDDAIWYRKNADWEVAIEGETFYMIRQRNIIAKQ